MIGFIEDLMPRRFIYRQYMAMEDSEDLLRIFSGENGRLRLATVGSVLGGLSQLSAYDEKWILQLK
jgi:hypothetical protein